MEKLVAAMDKLAGDDGLRASLGGAGFAHVQQFKTEIVGQKIAVFHKKLTDGL